MSNRWLWLAVLAGCAARSGVGQGPAPRTTGLVAGPAPEVSGQTTMTFAGARCTAAGCTCRDRQQGENNPNGENGPNDENGEDGQKGEDAAAETPAPSDGSKRFEIRLAAKAGTAAVELSGAGSAVAAGPEAKCFYVDLPAGGQLDVRLAARESTRGGGVAPVLELAEYGPKGPFWYDIVAVRCDAGGAEGRCDRRAADDWATMARRRRRGRLDPCGSSVVTRLAWETSGGQAERDGGLFRDFTATFHLEIKKFATQFAPGSPECVPK